MRRCVHRLTPRSERLSHFIPAACLLSTTMDDSARPQSPIPSNMKRRSSPPPSPPSPDPAETGIYFPLRMPYDLNDQISSPEFKLSRKRECEVSSEPALPAIAFLSALTPPDNFLIEYMAKIKAKASNKAQHCWRCANRPLLSECAHSKARGAGAQKANVHISVVFLSW